MIRQCQIYPEYPWDQCGVDTRGQGNITVLTVKYLQDFLENNETPVLPRIDDLGEQYFKAKYSKVIK